MNKNMPTKDRRFTFDKSLKRWRASETAAYLGVHPITLRRWEPRLGVHFVGNRRFYFVEQVLAFEREGTPAQPQPEQFKKRGDKQCSASGCPESARSKGLCSKHYQAARRKTDGRFGKNETAKALVSHDPAPTHPLAGKYFHTFRTGPEQQKVIAKQGLVIGPMPGSPLLLVQWFEWVMGEPSHQRLVDLDELREAHFYRSEEQWRHEWEYGPHGQKALKAAPLEIVNG